MRVICVLFRDGGKNEAFAETCYQLTPDIALRGQEAVFLEIGKCRGLYKEESVLQRLQILLKRFGRSATVTIADNVLNALMEARSGKNCSRDDLPLSFLEDSLDPFALDPQIKKATAKILVALSSLGLKTLGEFRRLPVRDLVSRFGSSAETAWLRLNNIQIARAIPWPRWKYPEQVAEKIEFLDEEWCAAIEPLLFQLRGALDRCMARLRGRSLRAQVIRIRFKLEKNSNVREPERNWSIALYSPQGTATSIIPILRDRLKTELERRPLEALVTALKVEILETTPGFHGQRNFFHNREEREEALNGLVGRIAQKLGSEQIFQAETTERYFPEHSWKKCKVGSSSALSLGKILPFGKRPLRIFQPPLILHRVGRFLMEGGRRWRITEVEGPERIKGEWWDEALERDYFEVQTESGEALWIFSDSRGGLFLHGVFE
jgi:protein ImuB